MKNKTTDIEGAARDGAHLFMWAVVFAAISVLVTGYRVYFHNQALQIPLVRLLNDPSLYPRDPFAATLPYYASMLWRVVALFARAVPLEPLLLALFLVERVIVVYAAGNLALALAPRSRLSMFAAMAFLATDPVPILGGGTIMMPYFEQTSLAVGFLMMSIAAFYRKRPIPWAIWLAAGFSCNSMYGVYAITYLTAAVIVIATGRKSCKVPIRWVAAGGLFVLLSMPTLLLSAAAYDNGTTSTALWLAACKARVPHHIFPSTWPWVKYARFATLMLTVGCGVSVARGFESLKKHALAWSAVALAWAGVAVVAERAGAPSLMILQPARATDLWYCFGPIALMAACLQNRDFRRGSAALALVPFVLVHPTGQGAAGEGLFAIGGSSWVLSGRPGASMMKTCAWASANTPKNAVFLVNPTWGEFRGISRRSAFVTWKDGSALLWCRPYATCWCERMRALGYDPTEYVLAGQNANKNLNKLYDAMTDSDARILADRYGITYWIVRQDHPSALKTLYHNRFCKVLLIR